ncbi:hypothetical protein Poli38472_009174 [Pythium oligandrum]|uniref:Major facilitator superfamily (MFS) profile domain-containing protein n=1 Tax=Pythium oligandrum TaxID=41045 RepID=A0A8K1CMD7_PYTOL|nr:hypothetical protein Poli38472_009174 [Pythium oligandrum]|eukprot:TMW65007.1 hypothetical protein Poli38472_009174 [Pythium oligandrum]
MSEGSRTGAIFTCLFVSLVGVVQAYFTGVTSYIYYTDSFINDFCVGKYGSYEDCTSFTSRLPEKWKTFELWMQATGTLGGVVGALLGAQIADSFGRRAAIITGALIAAIATVVMSVTPAGVRELLYAMSVVQGLGIGTLWTAPFLYIVEVAPKGSRGLFGAFNTLAVLGGSYAAFGVFALLVNRSNEWRIEVGLGAVPPVLLVLGSFCIAESPRWIFLTKGSNAAESELQRIRRTQDVSAELEAINDQVSACGSIGGWNSMLEFAVLKRVLVVNVLLAYLIAGGYNLLYVTARIAMRDFISNINIKVFLFLVVEILALLVALRQVDHSGRTRLLKVGAIALTLANLIVGISQAAGCDGEIIGDGECQSAVNVVIFVTVVIASFIYCMSWYPVTTIYPFEIFPVHVRAKATGLSFAINALFVFLVSWIQNSVDTGYLSSNAYFFIHAGIGLLCAVFIHAMCPETKGVFLEQTEHMFASTTARAGHHEQSAPIQGGKPTMQMV